jgi:hypothetical protein
MEKLNNQKQGELKMKDDGWYPENNRYPIPVSDSEERGVMRPTHPHWAEFTERLNRALGSSYGLFSSDDDEWRCPHGRIFTKKWPFKLDQRAIQNPRFPLASVILEVMNFGPADIEASRRYRKSNDGARHTKLRWLCECEMLHNVKNGMAAESDYQLRWRSARTIQSDQEN